MNTVLIFGAKGTLGQALVSVFESDKSYTVTSLDKDECDITDVNAVAAVLDTYKPHITINAAAINAVDDIETDDDVFQKALAVNGHAPGIIARACKERNIVFVHYSTDYVFDGTVEAGYTEDAVPHPLSRYAETKLQGEKEVIDDGGMYYLIRVSRLFGRTGLSDSSKRSFFDLMLALAETRDTLDVVSDQVSVPTYAPDAATFTKTLIEEQYPYGVYHGANSGRCSWYEWAQEIFALKHIDMTINKVPATHFPRPAKAPMHSVLLNTKGPQQRSWEEALEEYLK